MERIKNFKRADGAPNKTEIKKIQDYAMNRALLAGAQKKVTDKSIKFRFGIDQPEFSIITRSFRKDMLLEYLEDYKLEKIHEDPQFPATSMDLKPRYMFRELILYMFGVL